ncbi:MAG: carboxypeptidase regulatory-like domain-containing protein [Anaerolineae bacterium]|nr:carboxypeptidase regulatory-like domain-containing protein [Anaerolineae bacterium]
MRRAVVLLAVLIALAAHIGLTAAQEPVSTPDPSFAALEDAPKGSIRGKVTNSTAASTVPAGLEITLIISDENGQPVQRSTTTLDADGEYTFPIVPIVDAYRYVAVTAYRDRIFSSTFAVGTTAVDEYNLPITLYEPTEDPAVLSIIGTVAQIKAAGSTLEVRQVFRVRNSSDRIYTTSQDLGSLRFVSLVMSLPPGAQVISFDNAARYVVSQENFSIVDTAPVLPGDDNLVIVVYILPYTGQPALIEQPVNYAFDGQARVLISPDTMTVSGDQFPALGEETLGTQKYRSFGSDVSLQPGDVLRYEVSGVAAPEPTAASSGAISASNLLLTVIALLGVGLILAAIVLYIRGRRAAPLTPEQEIERLVRQLHTLDQQHAAGQLAHDLWHRQRAPLQARLDEILGPDSDDE